MTHTDDPDIDPAAEATASELIVKACSRSLRNYLQLVRIDGSTGPVRLGRVIEPWQCESIYPVMDAIEGVAGINPDYRGPTCFWRDLPQGHDKTSGIARMLNGALAFSRRPLRINVFARDKIQTRQIYDFARAEAQLNPWLARRLDFMSDDTIRGHAGGRVKLYASNFEANAGHKYDIAVCEEVTWWPEAGEALFDQVYTRRHKRDGAVFVVLGNAGIKGTWQHQRYLEYGDDPNWDIYRTEGSVASWISPEKLARDKRSVIPSLARRVFDNLWVDETEQTYLTRAELDACLARAEALGLRRLERGEPGIKYVVAIDYGSVKDWCALAVVGFHEGECRVARLDVLRAQDFPPGPSGIPRVPTQAVRSWCLDIREKFGNCAFVFDTHQMEWLVQEFEGRWPVFRFEYRGGINNMKMAEHVRTLVVNQKLLWPRDIGLVEIENKAGRLVPYPLDQEFHDLKTKDMTYGYRWDHDLNKHDDRATAVGMAAFFTSQIDMSAPFPVTGIIPRINARRTPERVLHAPVGRFNIYGGSADE